MGSLERCFLLVAGGACLLNIAACAKEQGFGLPTGERDLLSFGGVSGCLSNDIPGKI